MTKEEEARACELDLIADGWAQLSWAALFVSSRVAEKCAGVAQKYEWRARFQRDPYLQLMVTAAIGGALLWLLGPKHITS